MKIYTAKLQGTTPMLFGRQYAVPRLNKETHAEYEVRTWRERLWKTEVDGVVVLSPLMIKNCLRDAAKYLSESIPGKGKSTYTKHFKSGLMVFEQIPLSNNSGRPLKSEDVQPLWLNVPSDGMTGGTKRVPKAFPQISSGWQGTADIHVLDDTITKDVLLRHLTEAGNFIGVGAMRVQNGGISGRFKVLSINEAR